MITLYDIVEDKKENYVRLRRSLRENLGVEKDYLANLANASAIFNHYLQDINWVGFYLLKEDQLVLGPFQGKPACPRIDLGKGVCGTAFAEGRVIRVDDVETFPGHIACDSASRSEIVLPIRRSGVATLLLDVDSPFLNRFDGVDEEGLGSCVRVLEQLLWR